MFRRILIPVDGSKAALAAVKAAFEIGEKFDSELQVLCVYRHYSLLEASMSMVRPEEPENLDDSMRDYAKSVVENAKVRIFVTHFQKRRGTIGYQLRGLCLIVL